MGMSPSPSSPNVSRRMKATRQRDTPPELALRSRLHARGYRYRVDARPIAGARRRADLLFSRARVAVYVDGCFWHSCPKHGTWPKANAEWWRAKILGNVARDRETDLHLFAAGWRVIRVWEHEPVERAIRRVAMAVARGHRAKST